MSAIINDPFLLASYDRQKKLTKPGSDDGSSAFVSHDGGPKEGYATTTVQGDGLHVIDVRT
jgi:hypothetical protein